MGGLIINLKFTGHKKVIGNNISAVSFRNKCNEIIYINADEVADKNSFALEPQIKNTLSYSGISELNLFCEAKADIDINIMQELKTIQKLKVDKTPIKVNFGGITTEIIVKNITGDTVCFNLNSSFKANTSYSVASSESLKISEAFISYINIKSDSTSNIEIFAGR